MQTNCHIEGLPGAAAAVIRDWPERIFAT